MMGSCQARRWMLKKDFDIFLISAIGTGTRRR
jgi:hypothetical protein